MFIQSAQHLGRSAIYALTATSVIIALLFAGFFLAEPSITYGQAGPGPFEFSIEQTITDETSFLVAPTDVSMSGNINGVTGGQATGTTDFSIISNNSTGYYVTMYFEDNGSGHAMLGDVSGIATLYNYGSTTEPSYGYYLDGNPARFAYTVTSLTDSDTDDSFLNNGSVCNSGSTETANTCWMAPDIGSGNAFRIVDRDTAAVTGATSTITFNVTVPSGASPVPTAETHTATATLSLFTQ